MPFFIPRFGKGYIPSKAKPAQNMVTPSNVVGSYKPTGSRAGAIPQTAQNASATAFLTKDSLSDSQSKAYVLPELGDYVAMTMDLTVTPTGNTSTTTDILSAIDYLEFVAGGTIMKVRPTDLYDITQRFNQFGKRPSVTDSNSATAVSASYKFEGLSLPVNRGPYTLIVNTVAASAFGTSTTALSVAYTISFVIGATEGHRSRFVYTSWPGGAPSASGVADIASIASIQNVPLTELFITGMTSNTADISTIQIQSQGNAVTNRETSSAIVARCNSLLTSDLQSTELFPLLGLGTDLTLGRGAQFLVNFGASPSSSMYLGFYWLD